MEHPVCISNLIIIELITNTRVMSVTSRMSSSRLRKCVFFERVIFYKRVSQKVWNNCSNLLVNLLDPISTPGPWWSPRQASGEKELSRCNVATSVPYHVASSWWKRNDVTWPWRDRWISMRLCGIHPTVVGVLGWISVSIVDIKAVGHPREYRCRASFKVHSPFFFLVRHGDKYTREFEKVRFRTMSDVLGTVKTFLVI